MVIPRFFMVGSRLSALRKNGEGTACRAPTKQSVGELPPGKVTGHQSLVTPLSLSSHGTPRLLLCTLAERNLLVSRQFQGARPAGMSPLYRCLDAHD
jgi:hypothetical protein